MQVLGVACWALPGCSIARVPGRVLGGVPL